MIGPSGPTAIGTALTLRIITLIRTGSSGPASGRFNCASMNCTRRGDSIADSSQDGTPAASASIREAVSEAAKGCPVKTLYRVTAKAAGIVPGSRRAISCNAADAPALSPRASAIRARPTAATVL